MRYFLSTILFLLFSQPLVASAKINVFACEPEWAALATVLGGEQVDVFSATTGLQDPHNIQARPSLLAKARQTDLLVCTGAELEIGWLPLLLRQVGNPGIQPGQPGYFMASDYIALKEIPTSLDRSQGDLHASGNPHIQTNPHNIAQVAAALNQRLQEVEPSSAQYYQSRYHDFSERWEQAIETWETRAKPLRDTMIVVNHANWFYMEEWLGLQRVGEIEPKPGLPATSAHLAQLVQQLQEEPAAMIINAAYQSQRSSQWLAKRTDIPVVILPFTVGGTPQADNLFTLFDDTIDRLLEVNK